MNKVKKIPEGRREIKTVGDLKEIINALEDCNDDTRVLFRDSGYNEYTIIMQPTHCNPEDKDTEGVLLNNSIEFYIME